MMIELKRLNVVRRVDSEEKAAALEAQGFKRLTSAPAKENKGKGGKGAKGGKETEGGKDAKDTKETEGGKDTEGTKDTNGAGTPGGEGQGGDDE